MAQAKVRTQTTTTLYLSPSEVQVLVNWLDEGDRWDPEEAEVISHILDALRNPK